MISDIYSSGTVSVLISFVIVAVSVINGSVWSSIFSYNKFKGRILFSPAVGLGVISVFFFPWSWIFGFGTLQTWSGLITVSVISIIISRKLFPEMSSPLREWREIFPGLVCTILLAGVISLMMGCVDIVKFQDHENSFRLAAPLTDHVKTNIVQSFRNEGFPLRNPFASIGGENSHFSYYFLWYMLAAVVSFLFGPLSIAWDGDMAMTIVTSFASLLTVMGLSISLCRDRLTELSAARWSLLFSLGGPIVQIVTFVISQPTMNRILASGHGLETWVAQAPWVPQHVLSGTIVVLALLLQQELLEKKSLRLQSMTILLLASLISAGFGMSAWVGGVSFLLCVTAIVMWQLVTASDRRSACRIMIIWMVTAAVSAFMAVPYLLSQIGAAAGHGRPVGISPWHVLAFVPAGSILNHVSYWVLFLPLQMGCVYIPFLFSIRDQMRGNKDIAIPVILISFMCLIVSWLFESKIANNDLGWRAVIPALITMSAISGAGMSRAFLCNFMVSGQNILQRRSYILCIMFLAVSLPSGLWSLKINVIGDSILQKKLVEDDYWRELRNVTPVSGRVLTFPDLYRSAESWSVNIGGGLLTQRKSCYLSHEYMRAFSGSWPHSFTDEADRRIHLFYGGLINQETMSFMHDKLHCKVIGITQNEKIWSRISGGDHKIPLYHVVKRGNGWLILSEQLDQ